MATTHVVSCGPFCTCAAAAEREINTNGHAPSIQLRRREAPASGAGRRGVSQLPAANELLSMIHKKNLANAETQELASQVQSISLDGNGSATEFPYPKNNPAFTALGLPLDMIHADVELSNITELPQQTVSLHEPTGAADVERVPAHDPGFPPDYIQPHPPHKVFAAPVKYVRELTKPGALKRIYHMSMDVTKYPLSEGEHWMLGGSFGITAPNSPYWVDKLLEQLCIPPELADEQVQLDTTSGRWPTVWGDEKARSMITTRRDLLTWATDFMSTPVTQKLLRVLAEYDSDYAEKTILTFLCSQQGQGAFCKMRSLGSVSLLHLLAAFPHSRPPLDLLLSVLPQLMPRWYSLSNDPTQDAGMLDFAFTVAHIPDWQRGRRHGVATTYLEDLCKEFVRREAAGQDVSDIKLPMFRGLQSNPFARDFQTDGPMILIGAGVGIAPFRGFVQRRLSNASCLGKVWIIQGCRDHTLDAIYDETWDSGSVPGTPIGEAETPPMVRSGSVDGGLNTSMRYLAESRAGRKEYVQDEVRRQSSLIWNVISSEKGRVYMCGAGEGFNEEVEKALVDVIVKEAGVSHEEAVEMWKKWNDPLVRKYIKEVW